MTFLFLSLFLYLTSVFACTNLIVTKTLTAEGFNMISYSADGGRYFGELFLQPGAKHEAGSKRKIINWDTGKLMGEINEVEETFNVVGNMNEYGVAISETTFNGLDSLAKSSGIIDYGSLIYVALQRAKTAQSAITIMTNLLNEYGYASTGESFTIADPDEVWVMELIGKGDFLEEEERDGHPEKIVWVATRIPEGHVCAHANQARIRKIDWENTDEWKWSTDVFTFAKRHGLTTAEQKEDFDFSEAYNPISFTGARACDARAWVFFKEIGVEGMDAFEDYVLGKDLSKRMELSYKLPAGAEKITVDRVKELMGNHYEGTVLDMRFDLGAGPHRFPNRNLRLPWKAKPADDQPEADYVNERPIATQQTGWSCVAQLRPKSAEHPLGGLFWFGLDDAYTTVYMPFYTSITSVASCLLGPMSGKDAPNLNRFSLDSLFWVTNMVAAIGYSNSEMIHKEILARIGDFNTFFAEAVAQADEEILSLVEKEGMKAAIEFATTQCRGWAEKVHRDWLAFHDDLFRRWMHLAKRETVPGYRDSNIDLYGYNKDWYEIIADHTNGKFRLEDPIVPTPE